MSGNDPWLLTLGGRGRARRVGSGKGCWRGATAANGVKPTLTPLSGWGRRAGAQGGRAASLATPATLLFLF